MKKVKIALIAFVSMATTIILVAILPYNPRQLSEAEIVEKAYAIYEQAAISVPHLELDPDSIRNNNIALFGKVENGDVLTFEESFAYRIAYQQKLFINQRKLGFFDKDMQVRKDVEMHEHNNVGSMGIEGSHDHHDESMRANLRQILQNIDKLEDSNSGWASKVLAGIYCYKDATDILQHLATVPQTKSVAYKPSQEINSELEALSERFLENFKKAQFANINSKSYWLSVDSATFSYVQFIALIQKKIGENTSPLQRSIIGRWAHWKNLGPDIDGQTKRQRQK